MDTRSALIARLELLAQEEALSPLVMRASGLQTTMSISIIGSRNGDNVSVEVPEEVRAMLLSFRDEQLTSGQPAWFSCRFFVSSTHMTKGYVSNLLYDSPDAKPESCSITPEDVIMEFSTYPEAYDDYKPAWLMELL